MGATRLASGIKAIGLNKGSQTVLITLMSVSLALKSDAGRVAPISGSVLCLSFMLAFSGSGTFTILQKLYLPSILHLTLIRRNSLTINDLLSVRYCKFHLHTSYTPHTPPHGTNTEERHHGIGGQESLSLRQISLRPYGVKAAAYVQFDCAAAE